MSNDYIHINSKKNISTLLGETETKILKAGGNFNGTNEKGQFSGKTILGQIQGEYHLSSKKLLLVKI